jgi:hypothetical protein
MITDSEFSNDFDINKLSHTVEAINKHFYEDWSVYVCKYILKIQ